MIKAYHLYTGPDGNSHFQVGRLEEHTITSATQIHFKESPVGSSYDWHTAPANQFVLTLSGTLEFTMKSGASFTLHAGEVLIAQDLTGSGHYWRLLGNGPWKRAYVLFEENTAIDFIADSQ